MHRPIAIPALPLPALLIAGLLAASPALAQGPGEPRPAASGRSVTATGQTKPPAPGVPQAQSAASTQEQMLKAQRAARERDKAWDAKMNKTMGSICKGC